jgi:uncharacterized phiE125 gp8 family phage protein
MTIPLGLLKSHVRVDFDEDDALLSLYLSAATSHFERATRRLLSQQTRTLKLGAFIDSMIPFPPLVSLTSVSYVDGDGNAQTLAADRYQLDQTKPIAQIRFLDPLPDLDPDASDRVTVTYVAGWNSPPADVVRAVLELAAGYYLTRESVATIQFRPVPFGVQAVIDNRSVREFLPGADP